MSKETQTQRVLYNHYGDENELKMPEVSNIFENQLKQINNIHERNMVRIKMQKKIDKDLYLRSKFKLINDKKRDSKSLKIETKNKKRVLIHTYKELKKISTMDGLIQFEIQKINEKLKKNSKYLDSSYSWTQKSADSPKDKVEKFGKIKEKCFGIEQELFFIKNTLLFVQGEKISEELSLFGEENKLEVAKLKSKLDVELKKLITKKDALGSKLKIKLKEIDENYKIEKQALELGFRAQIRHAENEYNEEFTTKKQFEDDRKIKSLEKIIEKKEEFKNFDAAIIEKKNGFIKRQKNEISLLKAKRKSFIIVRELQWEKERVLNLFKRLGMEEGTFVEKFENHLNKVEELVSTEGVVSKSSDFKHEVKATRKFIKSTGKTIKTFIKNNENKKVLSIVASDHFGILGSHEYKIINRKRLRNEYDLKIASELKEFSYDGDFKKANAQAYLEFVDDWTNELNILNAERRKALIERIQEKGSTSKKTEQTSFKIRKKEIKNHWMNELKLIKQALNEKTITKKAYKQKKTEYKIFCKENIYEEKLKNSSKRSKSVISSFKWRYFGRRKIWKKVYGSKIVENRRSIPNETFKFTRFLAGIINLILPGLAELTIFKQYKKGAIMLLITIAMYAGFLPFILGLSSDKFGGVLGLIDMGKSKLDWVNGVLPDARYYLLGGIIAVFLLVGLVAYNVSSAITAYKTGKAMEQGVRPMGWINTKRWLSNQGFPWLISLPGWILIIFIVVTPVITSMLLSFTNLGFNHEPPGKPVDWVRFEQYGKWWIFKDVGMAKSISRVLYWTILWTIISATLVIALGTLIAVIVNQNRVKFKKVWRIIYIIPWAIPAFVTIMFLKSAFQSDTSSLMNMTLMKLHFIDKPKDWMGDIWTVRIIIILIQGWLGHSYIFLLITGNMQSIPDDIYEASEIDGANNNQKFRYMTMPILMASIAPLLISQFTFAFNNFTIIALFTGGGPAFIDPTPFMEGSTDILISWIYKLTSGVAQIDGNMGFSAAMTMLAALISVGIASYGFAKSAAFRRY